MKKQDGLTAREESLMNFLWEAGEPMTAGEMAERLEAEGWNTVTLFKTVQNLTEEGCLNFIGLEKNKKSYARKLFPAFTKEEYYAGVMMRHGIDSRSIADITAAFLGVADKDSKERDAKVIAKLEEIIGALRSAGDEKDAD